MQPTAESSTTHSVRRACRVQKSVNEHRTSVRSDLGSGSVVFAVIPRPERSACLDVTRNQTAQRQRMISAARRAGQVEPSYEVGSLANEREHSRQQPQFLPIEVGDVPDTSEEVTLASRMPSGCGFLFAARKPVARWHTARQQHLTHGRVAARRAECPRATWLCLTTKNATRSYSAWHRMGAIRFSCPVIVNRTPR